MAATGTIALATENPQLGQDCVFEVTTDGIKGKRFPRVYVEAKQGEFVVYGEIRELDGPLSDPHPKDGPCTFPEMGFSSATGGWGNTPPGDPQGPASCTARLFYHDQHDNQVTLATVSFEAAGL